MLVGNIGTGKSLFAKRFALRENAVIINMDSIQASMSGGIYGRYLPELKPLYRSVEEYLIREAINEGHNIVIDRTNIDIKTRKRYFDLTSIFDCEYHAYDFGGGTNDSRNRRFENPRGISDDTWNDVYLNFYKKYERPMIGEGFSRVISPPARFKSVAFDFDGFLVENDFPGIGEQIPENIKELYSYAEKIEWVIIIWSCRSGSKENEMRQYLIQSKIPFDFINENPTFKTGSRKIFATRYYDDRNKLSRNQILEL